MKKTILALALAAFASSALAVDHNLSMGVGHASINGDGSHAVKLALSHGHSKYLSSEVSYLYSGEHQDATTKAFDAAAVGRYALTSGVELTGRLGVSRTFASNVGSTNVAWSPTYGLGVRYAVSDKLSASMTFDQYRDFANSGEPLNVTLVGGAYAF